MGLVKEDKGKAKPDAKADAADEPEDPPVVKQLKEIDDKYLEIEREYEREVQKLLVAYTKKQQPLLDERKGVLTAAEDSGPTHGTPALSGFWLKSMLNHPAFEDSVQEWDEPVLEFLSDIEKTQNEEDNSKGFTITFKFGENPYFTNTELTKEYITEETNPYCGEIEVKQIKSSEIDWKDGKNVTVEKIAKKIKGGGAKKNKQKGKEKEEPRPSFFREFFRTLSPDMKLPEDAREQARSIVDEGDEDDDDDDEELISYLMDSDHETGTALRDHIIPFAIRWFTGEAAPDYDREDGEESEEEDGDDDDDLDDSDDDEPPAKGRGKGGKGAAKKTGAKSGAETKPGETPKEECKQQ